MPNRRQTPARPAQPAAAPVSALQARKQELVRNAIWDAAIDLFFERGFDETTVDEIAAAAGVSQRSFFRYFASKADLLSRGLDHFGRMVSDAIAACPPELPPAGVLRHVVLQTARQTALYPGTGKIVRIVARYPAARQAQTARLSEAQATVTRAYARRLKSGRKGDIRPAVLAGMTMSLFDVALTTWLETGRPDMEAIVDDVFQTTRQMLD